MNQFSKIGCRKCANCNSSTKLKVCNSSNAVFNSSNTKSAVVVMLSV